MTAYFTELCRAMEMVAAQPRAVFLGQAVRCPGTAMYQTLEGVPLEQRIEFPVAEDMQMGTAIGMALNGDLPICIYPRFNFLLLAMSQLVLHLDKLPIYSCGGYKPKVIIRTAVATNKPLDPGAQHLGNFTMEFREMLDTVRIREVYEVSLVRKFYAEALEYDGSTILVEMAEKYAS